MGIHKSILINKWSIKIWQHTNATQELLGTYCADPYFMQV